MDFSPESEQATVLESRPEKRNFQFVPTKIDTKPPPGLAPEGMVWVPGVEFSMISEDQRGMMCWKNA